MIVFGVVVDAINQVFIFASRPCDHLQRVLESARKPDASFWPWLASGVFYGSKGLTICYILKSCGSHTQQWMCTSQMQTVGAQVESHSFINCFLPTTHCWVLAQEVT